MTAEPRPVDEPKCEGLAPFHCGNPSCPVHQGEPMNPDEIAAAVKPLRFWLTHSGWGARGERARKYLDAFEVELNGTQSVGAICADCGAPWRMVQRGQCSHCKSDRGSVSDDVGVLAVLLRGLDGSTWGVGDPWLHQARQLLATGRVCVIPPRENQP